MDEHPSITVAYMRAAGLMKEDWSETDKDNAGHTFEVTKEDLIHAITSEWLEETAYGWDVEVKDNKVLVTFSTKRWDD